MTNPDPDQAASHEPADSPPMNEVGGIVTADLVVARGVDIAVEFALVRVFSNWLTVEFEIYAQFGFDDLGRARIVHVHPRSLVWGLGPVGVGGRY